LAILGEQFHVGDEICGAGVSMRPKRDCISLWNKTASDHECTQHIREVLRKVLNLPGHIQLEYRYHKDALNWLKDKETLGPLPGSSSSHGPKHLTSPSTENVPFRNLPSHSTTSSGGPPATSGGHHR